MTARQKVLEFYKVHPTASLEDASKALDMTKGNIKAVRRVWIDKGLLERQDQNQKHKGLQSECEAIGIPVENVGNYWYKGKHYSIHVKNQQVSLMDIADLIV